MGGLVDSRAVEEMGREVEVRDAVPGVLGRSRGADVGACLGGVTWALFEYSVASSPTTAMDEVVGGATEMGATYREGPEERLDGAVANFAISRPSSPRRP